LDSLLKSWNFLSLCAPQKVQSLSPFQACFQSLLSPLISPEYTLLTTLTLGPFQALFFLLNWSFNHVFIKVNGPKTKIGINMALISIQDSLVVVFQPFWLPLCQLEFLAFHIHAKKNFCKRKKKLSLQLPSFELTTMQMSINAQPFNQFMFRDNFYNSRIITHHD